MVLFIKRPADSLWLSMNIFYHFIDNLKGIVQLGNRKDNPAHVERSETSDKRSSVVPVTQEASSGVRDNNARKEPQTVENTAQTEETKSNIPQPTPPAEDNLLKRKRPWNLKRKSSEPQETTGAKRILIKRPVSKPCCGLLARQCTCATKLNEQEKKPECEVNTDNKKTRITRITPPGVNNVHKVRPSAALGAAPSPGRPVTVVINNPISRKIAYSDDLKSTAYGPMNIKRKRGLPTVECTDIDRISGKRHCR